ncbi:ABC transporter ATP-binding protein [Natrarchaeobius oligotrophus]|uniref:ABC transporter ATP-binding protein n=1 Tax=Natrarchaeobius chitinivorans TaxID=1679083 RepID=A0A3N6M8P8_NATCH|nr:ABC transporter ATP-binding protein [Natrarchaeobius chitinivorans]RQH00049.1 ABC transporter ATP-binding protein [Natrarchaeobius chitinivorans]
METVVVAEGLEKTYGETVALSGASLSVERGEVFALIGPNGAGKTTLVRAMTGTTEPDAGSVRLLGDSPRTVDRNRLGVLPQAFSPPDRLTARELVSYYAGLYDGARDPDDVLADVGLLDAGRTWYEDLSGGQQRRVCVGSTLVNDPDVLFLDEPTTGIDPAGRRTVWRLIEELATAGTTVVLTTHDMVEAERLADRVGLLADGALVACGDPDDLVRTHGGESRLRIETDAEPSALDFLEQPVARAMEAGGGRRTLREDGALVVSGVEPAEIGRLVDTLEERGIEYTGLSWSEPDLEDVYLALADETERERTGDLEADEREGADATGDEAAGRAGETA